MPNYENVLEIIKDRSFFDEDMFTKAELGMKRADRTFFAEDIFTKAEYYSVLLLNMLSTYPIPSPSVLHKYRMYRPVLIHTGKGGVIWREGRGALV